MKKTGILNAKLMEELTKLRHTDKMVICDAGFPVPKDATLVDVSLVAGTPTLMETLKAVLNEVIVEKYVVFDIMKTYNQEYYQEITSMLAKQEHEEMSMPAFIDYAADAKFYVRTGEMLPCSNILLVSASGVPMMCDPLNVVCE